MVNSPNRKYQVALTTLCSSTQKDWHFDSGCSRHMTGDKSFVLATQPCNSGHVTFGDGVKGKVIRKSRLNYLGLPILKEDVLVEGLTTNLISISQ